MRKCRADLVFFTMSAHTTVSTRNVTSGSFSVTRKERKHFFNFRSVSYRFGCRKSQDVRAGKNVGGGLV